MESPLAGASMAWSTSPRPASVNSCCATSCWIHAAARRVASGIALQIALLDCLGVPDHLPAIAGQIAAMNDEHADGAAARGLFILIGPAAVVGERLALEKLLVVRGRLVHDDQRDFAFQVNLLAVGPG